MMYAGDEDYGDDITSGPLSDDNTEVCADCGQRRAVYDSDEDGNPLCLACSALHRYRYTQEQESRDDNLAGRS